MKKKGFTLIELLAVIVILAIIAVITIPIISGVINSVKKSAFESTVNGLIESANVFYANNLKTMKDTDEYIFDYDNNNGKTSDGEELSYKGESPIGGKIILRGDGTVQVLDITNGEYYATKETDESEILVSKESSILTRDELTEIVNNLQEEIENIKNNTLTEQKVLDQIYPVGSIYISTDITSTEAVSEKLGGTWEVYASGRTLVGVGTGTDENQNSKSFLINETGGEYTHTLSVDEMPSHSHITGYRTDFSYGSGGPNGLVALANYSSKGATSTNTVGNGKEHNNIQPYITVYMYKRVS